VYLRLFSPYFVQACVSILANFKHNFEIMDKAPFSCIASDSEKLFKYRRLRGLPFTKLSELTLTDIAQVKS
jgi:hypothetical protein